MPPRRNHMNNEPDPAFTAAVAQAVADLLPTLTARITDEIHQNENNGNRRNARRVNTRGSRNDGDAQPIDIHVWLESIFHTRRKKGAKAGTQEEQAKHFKWGLDDFVLDRILNTECTNVAQVANVARNIKIFRDRSKNKGNNKRDRDGHRIRPSETPSQGSNQRAYDRSDNDRYGSGGRYGNRDRGCGLTRISRFDANIMVVLMGHQARGDTRIMSHLPPCNTCVKFHLGKVCHKATGACFEFGEVGHLAKDCKKSSTSNERKRFGNKRGKSDGKWCFQWRTGEAGL
nr:hypothetical protein [Tanacetum cinerariifolium]